MSAIDFPALQFRIHALSDLNSQAGSLFDSQTKKKKKIS
jgi:hypothetical protein